MSAKFNVDPSRKILIGLGNPGAKYQNTPHNLGFELAENLAKHLQIDFSHKRKLEAEIAVNADWIIAKPQTFMNLSGTAVQKISRYFRAQKSDIIVAYDDIALPVGKIRLRAHGSAGGHNGMRSIIAAFASEEFPRLRLGIKPERELHMAEKRNFVLRKISATEKKIFAQMLKNALNSLLFWQNNGIVEAMNEFN